MFIVILQVISELHQACVLGNSSICKTDVNEELPNHPILACLGKNYISSARNIVE
jgi:hypothetical protein